MSDPVVKSVAFSSKDKPYRGFTIKASYLEAPHAADALVEITRDGATVRRFMYPAYKVWNLMAHFTDIVDGEIEGDARGYAAAGSDGLGGCVTPSPVPGGSDE